MTNPEITLVLADDHAVVRKGLLAFFDTTDDIRVVSTAATAAEAVEAVEQFKPQVLLLDLLLPDQTAVLTIEQVKSANPETQVVVLTSHEGGEYIAEVLEAGALSYVLKDISPDDLITAVRRASQGRSMLNPRLAAVLVDGFKNEELYNRLTERERDVLQHIAKGLTNGEIAERLYISETTVKSHVSNILSKLYLTDRTKLAVYAWEKGLMKK